MTRDELLRLVGESGVNRWGSILHFSLEELERFAALVAAHEREACAKLATDAKLERWYEISDLRDEIAAAIRARGNDGKE